MSDAPNNYWAKKLGKLNEQIKSLETDRVIAMQRIAKLEMAFTGLGNQLRITSGLTQALVDLALEQGHEERVVELAAEHGLTFGTKDPEPESPLALPPGI